MIMKNLRIMTSYRWSVEYDYQIVRTCDASCDPICRCATIEDVEVVTVDSEPSMSIKINNGKNNSWVNYKLSKIEKYCIDRISVYTGIYDIDNYDVVTGGGYYGEEIEDISFYNDVLYKNRINDVLCLETDYDKICYVLTLEYSFIPKFISETTSNVEVVQLRLNDINHRLLEDGFVKKSDVKYFKDINTSIPVGVLREGNTIVDGNNRLLHLLCDSSIHHNKKFSFIVLTR